MNIKQLLSDVFLFEGLSDQQFILLQPSLTLKSVNKNEHIFLEGQTASAFYIVINGRVKIYKISPNGDEHILHIHGKNEFIAESAMFDLKTYPANCEALDDTQVIRISTDSFIDLITRYPDLAIKMMSSYSKRLRQFVSIIEDLSFRNIKSRLAKFLIQNSRIENNIFFYEMDVSKKELASLLGTIPETLSRTLDFFKKKELISEADKKIVISDPEKVKLIADL